MRLPNPYTVSHSYEFFFRFDSLPLTDFPLPAASSGR